MRKVVGLVFCILCSCIVDMYGQIPDLIFSEYIEGSGSEKYLEIYNGTGNTVNLANYRVELYANGATVATNTNILSGTLLNGNVIVLKNSAATLYTGAATVASVCGFNGDDAVVLKNGTVIIDVIGKVGCDPGTKWQIGSLQTLDKTLIRKPDICAGYDGSEGVCPPVDVTSFPRLYTEWYQKNQDYIANLGSHTSGCGSAGITNRFFRSTQSGSWLDLTTWESSSTINGAYTAAAALPTYNNTDTIIIQTGHIVTINKAGFATDQTNVLGTLILSDSTDFDLNDGLTGVDLNVEGTFIDSTRNAIGFGILAVGTATTWKLGTTGTFVKLKSSSSTFYRDFFDGGISTIPATANWILRCVDNTLLPSFTSANMFFPNLIIENISGALWDMTSVGGSFNATTTTIKGSLDIGGTGTAPITMVQNSTTATASSNPIDVQGNLFIRAGSKFINKKTGSPDLFGGGLNIKGNTVVFGSLEIFNSISDNVRSNLILSGNNDQNVSGTGSITVTGFELNKTGASLNVNLGAFLTVTDTLHLIKGIVNVAANGNMNIHDTTVISSPASNYTNLPSNIGWESSFVNGKLTLYSNGSPSNPVPFAIPVGKGTNFRPIFLRNYSVNGGFQIEYFEANPRTTFGNTMGPGLDHISAMEYWNIYAPTGSPVANVELSFYDPNSGGVTNMADLRVAHFDGSIWTNEGNTATTGTPGANGTVTSVSQSSFSPFTLASATALNPLPLKDIHLTLIHHTNFSKLNWRVIGDENIEEYVIQKSSNKISVQNVYTQLSGRNTGIVNYYYTDVASNTYYRIQAKLVTGELVYSNWVLHNDKKNLEIYPNPAKDFISIAVNSPVQIQIIDVHGKILLQQNVQSNADKIYIKDLPSGVYAVKIMHTLNGRSATSTFIKY
jgi:hypothetical protein